MTDAKVWLCLFRVTGLGRDWMICNGALGDVSARHAMRVAGLCDVKSKVHGEGETLAW